MLFSEYVLTYIQVHVHMCDITLLWGEGGGGGVLDYKYGNW